MNEDDIDKIVNDKFAEYERDGMIGHDEDGYFIPDRPTTLSDRIARLDEVTYDGYKDVSDWHNNRISEGADPRSWLKSGLGYIPWDERIDGVAASMGAGMAEMSYQRNGGAAYIRPITVRDERVTDISLIALLAAVVFIGIVCCLFTKAIDADMRGTL